MDKVPASIEVNVRKFLTEAGQWRRIKAAYLYGSYAKGLASKWSDIDIAVISTDFSEDLDSTEFLIFLGSKTDVKVDYFSYFSSHLSI
jgi:predicted nucleotidyltransferase